ncbi:MAG: cation:proton antiporter [Chitinispirillaceae bacterium]
MEAAEILELVLLGLLMTVGFTVGSFGEYFRVPRVALYVLVGAFFSHDLLGRYIPVETGAWSSMLTDVALGLIAFIIGAELNWKRLSQKKKSVFWGVSGQSLGTVLVVTIGVWIYSILFLQDIIPITVTLVLGSIASATAPAATVAVIEEYRTQGPLTTMLFGIVALDDALAVIFFSIALSLGTASADLGALEIALWEIIGAILLGSTLGMILGWYARRIEEDELRLPIVLGFVFLTIGTALYIEVSYLLACMALGFVSKLLFRHKTEQWLHPMNAIRESIFLIFFTVAGLHFELDVFYSSFGFIIGYVFLRGSGKYFGAFIGTRIGGSPPTVYRNIGLGLMPQAGVAIGLALRASESGVLSGYDTLVLNLVLGSTILFELFSPSLARKGLTNAGEIGRRNE